MRRDSFIQQVFKIALPVALQCMLQSSFSIVDQIMVGSLGSVSVAAVGIAGKLSTLYSVVIGAVVSVAGIILSQYLGANDNDEADRGFSLHTLLSIGIGVVFMAVCLAFPVRLMGLYSADGNTVAVAAKYLRIIAFGFLPYAVSMMTSVRMRCMEKASLPLVCSIISSLLNTVLNYLLIFGKLGFPAMGANGAATATVISQGFNALLMVAAMKVIDRKRSISFRFMPRLTKMTRGSYLAILFPVLVIEFMWSLSENVYASVYGHIGTPECAAMTLTYPVQGLTVGALSGIAQAAGILIGKELGKGEKHSAYQKSRRLLLYGLIGSFVIAALTVLAMGVYTDFYNVEEYVKSTARQILIAFVVVLPVKVLNMILGGGIVRSGGQTRTMMIIELLGTWGFGVPLALLGAYVWKLSIPLVYFILSMEECVRLLLTWIVFVRKNWMKKL
ncbi:MAG: MATE family efflux transporter [Clostridia bacterium]|jgi:putative MATE family efflux protein|nr:MATE family efflux transporter [Clostridia bacterium]MBQ5544696.1 MATE family efflux transporter [Clostridia bacterium]